MFCFVLTLEVQTPFHATIKFGWRQIGFRGVRLGHGSASSWLNEPVASHTVCTYHADLYRKLESTYITYFPKQCLHVGVLTCFVRIGP